MAKFVLIDHSLGGIGGHHYDYAVHVLRAADAAGYETVVAANRRFRNRGGFPTSCRCLSLFRFHTYSKYTLFAGGQRRLIDPLREALQSNDVSLRKRLIALVRRPWQWASDLRHRGGPRRRVLDFKASCRRLFQKVPLADDDQVFVPTLSEIDLMALAAYWNSDPCTKLADWHLQFHFNIFDGREPDYPGQKDRLVQLRDHLRQTLSHMTDHRLYFYNTTEQLAAQYNRLGVARFDPLPYPVNDALFRSTSGRVAEGPLRVTCAGGSRTEKGFGRLAEVAQAVWDDLLATGKMQLLVQSKPGRMSSRPRLRLPIPKQAATTTCIARPNDTHRQPVVYVRYPLKIDDYVELVRRADVGLFLYDSDRYYVRRAGIMGEFLSAGVPVIVPAGCWLSEQIEQPIYDHLRQMRRTLPQVERIEGNAIAWRRQGEASEPTQTSDGSLRFGGANHPLCGELAVPAGATEVLIDLRRKAPTGAGTYVHLAVEQLDASGGILEEGRHILGANSGNSAGLAAAKLKQDAASIRLRWSNAYHDSPITLDDVTLDFLDSSDLPGGCAVGAVGLIAADAEQVPRLLREMADHYQHYRDTAEEFSRGWNEAHAPRRTIEALSSRAGLSLDTLLERAA